MIYIPKIVYKDEFDSTFYEKVNIVNNLNLNNIVIKDNINEIKKLLKKGCFKVPSQIINQSWGEEKIFYPFSAKLFKIVSNFKGDTSVQMHPLKNELWVALNDNTNIITEDNEKKLNYLEGMDIPKCTIHSLKQKSEIYEEQDNNIFDNSETIRIYDKLGRKTNFEKEVYKFLIPGIKRTAIILKLEDIMYNSSLSTKDRFVFIFKGEITIKLKDKVIKFNQKNELYFLSRDTEIINIEGYVRIVEIMYYGLENE